MRLITCPLYVRPQPQYFDEKSKAEFVAVTTETARNTTVLPLTRAEELMLDSDGCTLHGGYRYTKYAFRQICQLLAPGLFTFLPNLAGVAEVGLPEQYRDGHQAVGIFNQMVQLRSGRWLGARLLRNDATRLIDGWVSIKHQGISNCALFQQADAAIGAASAACFHSAVLTGRRMMLWFCQPTPFTRIPTDRCVWQPYSGYYLCNSESVGITVRATLAVLTHLGTCQGPVAQFGGRVRHAGRAFTPRIVELLKTLVTTPIPESLLIAGFHRLASVDLNLERHTPKGGTNQLQVLATYFNRRQHTQALAKLVEAKLQDHSRNIGAALQQQVGTVTRSNPTLLTLFGAMVAAALTLNFNQRESLERIAYRLLTQPQAD